MAGLLREFAWRARGRGADDLVRRYTDLVAETALRASEVSAEEAQAWREQVAQALAGEWPAERP
ncbi:hypothetical protein SAMN05661080_02090 [Modestobacter sp. DSM 44400]|uniref:hypothetical protein n=1 Tax=Modestobacter sp. DSM 44400 TaxID=1550230 RepID=UPI00089D90E0|nr:hypothetical protein [Modestobacter sp. DSM 44400]SDY03244.1 hypothetical protein SAMN05661080_02090 [Modestobacter sp. DSM 44400]